MHHVYLNAHNEHLIALTEAVVHNRGQLPIEFCGTGVAGSISRELLKQLQGRQHTSFVFKTRSRSGRHVSASLLPATHCPSLHSPLTGCCFSCPNALCNDKAGKRSPRCFSPSSSLQRVRISVSGCARVKYLSVAESPEGETIVPQNSLRKPKREKMRVRPITPLHRGRGRCGWWLSRAVLNDRALTLLSRRLFPSFFPFDILGSCEIRHRC